MDDSQAALLPGEHLDRLGYHGLQIIQNPDKFKFTLEAFLLTAFVKTSPKHRLIDLGTGNGVIPLLLAGQRSIAEIYGLELQPELASMAQRSTIINQLQDRVKIICGDLRSLPEELMLNSFDIVLTNPPYYPINQGVISTNDFLASAKFEVNCCLDEVIRSSARLCKGNGKLAMIYPSSRLSELFGSLSQFHLIPKRLCFIHPRIDTASNLVLMEARPGAKSGLEVLAPICIYKSDHTYTETMNQIFRGQVI